MATATKASKYIGNVIKSVTYSSIDRVSDSTESTTSFIANNKELFKEIYTGAKDLKKTYNRATSAIIDNKIYKAAEVGFKAIKEDIKTGNYYNKERVNKMQLEAMGDLGNFDDWEVGDFNFEESDVSVDSKNISATVKATSISSTEATCNMIMNTSNYLASTSKANTLFLAKQNAEFFSVTAKGMTSIDSGINKVIGVMTGPLMNHMENSKKYYEVTSLGITNIADMLKEINDRQKKIYESSNKNNNSNKRGYDDVIDYTGAPDIKQYLKNVKSNLKKIAGPEADLLLGDTLGSNSNLLLAFTANPLAIIPNMISSVLIPATLTKALKDFDTSMSGIFTNFLANMNKMAKDNMFGFKNKIGELFGISPNLKTTINTSNYNKGPVPFDGTTKKAITEVIPTHLRRIEKLLGGGNAERIFDYDNGKWTTDEKIVKRAKSIKQNSVDYAFSDITPHLEKTLEKYMPDNLDEQMKVMENLNNLLTNIYDDYGVFKFNDKKTAKKYKKYGVENEELMQVFMQVFSQLPKKEALSMTQKVFRARGDTNRQMKKIEDDGLDPLINYYNNSMDSKTRNTKSAIVGNRFETSSHMLNAAKDDKGHNVFYYLRVIASEINAIRTGGGINKKHKNGKNSLYGSFIDSTPDDNEEALKLYKERAKLSKNYDEKIAQMKKYGERSDVGTVSTFMPEYTAKAIVSQMSDQEYVEYYERLKEIEANENIIQRKSRQLAEANQTNKKKGTLLDRLSQAESVKDKFRVMSEASAEIYRIPSKALEKILETADKKIYQIMFGYKGEEKDENGKPIRGFMGHLINDLKKSFDNLNNYIEEKILNPIKEKFGVESFGELFEKIADRFGFGKEKRSAIAKKYKDEIKKVFGGAGRTVKNSLSTAYDPLLHQFNMSKEDRRRRKVKNDLKESAKTYPDKYAEYLREQFFDNDDDNDLAADEFGFGEFARGSRYITKSGITAISKGELIIPSDKNPFNPDRNKVNRRKEIQNEKRIKREFIKRNLDRDIGINANGTVDNNDEDYVDKIYNKVNDSINKTGKKLFGASDTDIENMKGKVISATKTAGAYMPTAVAHGLLGGGISLITGAIGGPLLGAAVGAAVGITKKSETIQRWLFGKEVDGEREGGFVSKKFQDSFKRYFPDMKNYGIAGAVTGLITPLGPIGGLIAGSAIGFCKANKGIQEYLFGVDTFDKDGNPIFKEGLIKKKTRENLKHAMPNMTVGAIGGLIAGPFGFVGNIALGASLGLLSTTEKFKDIMFGEENDKGEREGGVVGAIKEGVIDPLKDSMKDFKERFMDYMRNDILDPLKRFIEPFTQMITNGVTGLGRGIYNIFRRTIYKSIGQPIEIFLKDRFKAISNGWIGKLFKGAGWLGKNAISSPFKLLGLTGDVIRRRQIRKGQAYNMSAAQRLNFMQSRPGLYNKILGKGSGYKLKESDEIMAGFSDEQINDVTNKLGEAVGGAGYYDKQAKTEKRSLFKEVTKYLKDTGLDKSISYKDRNKLLKYASTGQIDKVNLMLTKRFGKGKNASRLDKDDRNALLNMLQGGSLKITDLYNRKGSAHKGTEVLLEELREAGMGNINKRNMHKYLKNYQMEKTFRKFGNEEQFLQDSNDPVVASINNDIKKSINEKGDKIIDILERIAGIRQDSRDDKDISSKTKEGKAYNEHRDNYHNDQFERYNKGKEVNDKFDKKADKRIKSSKEKISKMYPGFDTNKIPSMESSQMVQKLKSIRFLDKTNKRFEAHSLESLFNVEDMDDFNFIVKIQSLMNLNPSKINILKGYSKLTRQKVLKIIKAGHNLDGKFSSIELISKTKKEIIDRVARAIKSNKLLKQRPIAILIDQFSSNHKYSAMGDTTKSGRKIIEYATKNQEKAAKVMSNLEDSLSSEDYVAPKRAGLPGLFDKVKAKKASGKIEKEKSKGVTRTYNSTTGEWVKYDKDGNPLKEAKNRNNLLEIFRIKKKNEEVADNTLEHKSILGRLFSKLFGKKEKADDDEDKKGFMYYLKEKVNKVTGCFRNALSWVALIAAGVLGIAGSGHLIDWWRHGGGGDKVSNLWSKVKSVVAGKKNEEGNLVGGLRGLLFGNKNSNGNLIGGLRGIIFGSRESDSDSFKGGLLSGISNGFMKWYDKLIKPVTTKIHNFFDPWISGEKKFTEWLKDDVWGYYESVNRHKGIYGWIGLGFDKLGKNMTEIWEGDLKKEDDGLKGTLLGFWGTCTDFFSTMWGKLSNTLRDWWNSRNEGLEAGHSYENTLLTGNEKHDVSYTPPGSINDQIGFEERSFTDPVNNNIFNNLFYKDKYIVLYDRPSTKFDKVPLFIIKQRSKLSIEKNRLNKLHNIPKTYIGQIKADELEKVHKEILESETNINSIEEYVRYINFSGGFILSDGNTVKGKEKSDLKDRFTLLGPAHYGSSHGYQKDPSIANMKYGNSTIGDSGCGPVAATNLLNSINVKSAAQYAITKGFVGPNGGTNINYFNSILGANGVKNKQTTNKQDVLNALKNNKKVVILYIDKETGRSHFITATSLDGKGNMIIEDPDSPYSQQTVSIGSILDTMKSAVIVDEGASGYGTSISNLNTNNSFVTTRANAKSTVERSLNNSVVGALLGESAKEFEEYAKYLIRSGEYSDKIIDTVDKEALSVKSSARFSNVFKDKKFNNPIDSIVYWTRKILTFPIYLARYMENRLSSSTRSTRQGPKHDLTYIMNNVDKAIHNMVINNKKRFNDFNSKRLSGHGHSYQKDPSIANMKYGNSTIGDSGCGPVAATNLLNSMGSNIDINSAARYAENNGYISNDGGTDINYFNDILSAKGVSNIQTENAYEVANALSNGNKAVILGRDTDKSSPFSNRMHFINAIGTDNKGNAIIEDPDSSKSRKIVPMNKLLKGMKASVIAGHGNKKFNHNKKSNNTGFGTITDKEKEILIQKIHERTISSESGGDYSALNLNDAGYGYSVGIIQFNGGNAKRMFTRLAEKLSGEDKQKALYYAGRAGTGLSSAEGAKMKAFLNSSSVAPKNKEVQNQMASELYWDTNSKVAADMYLNDQLKDPRSIVMIAHIANSGPALVTPWSKKYIAKGGSKSAASCLTDTRNSLKSYDSYWGQSAAPGHKQHQFSKGWLNIIENDYKALSNWDGKTVNGSLDVSFSPDSSSSSSSSSNNSSNSLSGKFDTLSDTILRKTYGSDKIDLYNKLFGSTAAEENYYTNDTVYDADGQVSSDDTIAKYQKRTAGFMHSYENRNTYNQSMRNKQGETPGYSDCSSMAEWALRNGIGDSEYSMLGAFYGSTYNAGTTHSIWQNTHGEVVDEGSNGKPDEKNLQLGDLLIYGRGTNKTPGNTVHVEMYTGPNEIMGHGSATGPTVKNMANYKNNNYFGAMRFINNDSIEAGANQPGGYLTNQNKLGQNKINAESLSGSGHLKTSNEIIKTIKNRTCNNSSSCNKNAPNAIKSNPRSGHGGKKFYGPQGDSNNTYSTNNLNITPELFVKVMNIIVEVLSKIADNSDKLTLIYKLLSDKLNLNISKEELSGAAKSAKSGTSSSELNAIKSAITNSLKNTPSSSSSSKSSLFDKDIEYILSSMSNIAAQ